MVYRWLKYLLLLSSILSLSFTKFNEEETKINYIVYQADNFSNSEITFLIYYSVKGYDELDLTINFENSDGVLEHHFSSKLSISGNDRVYASVPLKELDKDYRVSFIFKSLVNEEQNEQVILMDIDKQETINCNLDIHNASCVTNGNEIIKVSQNTNQKSKLKISLKKYQSNYLLLNNQFDLSNLKIEMNLIELGEEIDMVKYGVIYLRNKIEESELLYIEGKGHPLMLRLEKEDDNTYSFVLDEYYYLDYKSGIMYEYYQSGLVRVDEIFLPLSLDRAEFLIEFDEFSTLVDTLTVGFSVEVNNSLIGKCYEARYCLRGY